MLICVTIFPLLDSEAVAFHAALILLKQYFYFLYRHTMLLVSLKKNSGRAKIKNHVNCPFQF